VNFYKTAAKSHFWGRFLGFKLLEKVFFQMTERFCAFSSPRFLPGMPAQEIFGSSLSQLFEGRPPMP
jgi:hypothetical protein